MAAPVTLLKTAVFSILVPGTVAGLIPWILARYDRESPILNSRFARLAGTVSSIGNRTVSPHCFPVFN